MYHKCTWCKARITIPPVYYTQGFLKLSPGFGVYCSAQCSLSAYQACLKPDKSHLLCLSAVDFFSKAKLPQ